MRAVIQRVQNASVEIDGKEKTSINNGLLILLGIEEIDTIEDIKWLAQKIIQLRIFQDKNGLMNLSVLDINGEVMIVSQFILFAGTKKGNRPSFTRSAKPDVAIPLYEQFIITIQHLLNKPVMTGEFGAHMKVTLINDGPVTILIDTKNKE